MKELDVRELACPGPVLKLRDLLDAGEREIIMRVADELSRSNVTRFATSRGAEVAVEAPADGIVRGHRSRPATTPPRHGPARTSCWHVKVPQFNEPAGPRVVQITASTMGTGDDELGALLMRSFLKTQAQLERRPDAILFYNDGVKLCCDGSLLLADLEALAAEGVEIIACGTCLNFFELADRLRVGRVTDMLEIASRLAEAGRIVRP